jgi:hypothetical protein
MARSRAEIEADIAVTRRQIGQQLDGLRRRVPDRWWTPYAMLAGALALGAVASQVPMLKLLSTGARVVKSGLLLASTVATVDQFLVERPRPAARPNARAA